MDMENIQYKVVSLMDTTQINIVKSFFIDTFSAAEVAENVCRPYLDDEIFVVGLLFTDTHINYSLMSETDFLCYSEKERQNIKENKCSPDNEILLIFYEKDESVNCKIVNGIASKLFDYAEKFCGKK